MFKQFRCAVTTTLVLALAASPSTTFAQERDTTIADVQTSLNETVTAERTVPGLLVTVERDGEAAWSFATGGRTLGMRNALPDDEFRIASLTKTLLAAALIRLVEDGRLQLNQPIAQYLTDTTREQLNEGGLNTRAITISHLLTHASGLNDHASSPAFLQRLAVDPAHRWTRQEQLALALANPPLGPPGGVRRYSDTGYVILGEILEQVTGETLAISVPRLLEFPALGLTHSYWETAQDDALAIVPANRVHAYQDGTDTAALNPSFDLFGGGGLVSTTRDVARFYAALFGGRVFKTERGMTLMLSGRETVGDDFGQRYAYGIYRLPGTGEAECWGHPGHWGLLAGSCGTTKGRVAFAISINAAGTRADAVLNSVTLELLGTILAADGQTGT
ncbi:MAG: beta-lactamase family protein [Sphingopyxis sp.]|nr:beta-lactamase family protein [Sphingopyxis sp.]